MEKVKVLVLVGGWCHDFDKCGQILVDFLKASGHVAPTLETNRDIFASDGLSRFDAVLMYTQGGDPTPAQVKGLTQFVKGGGGYVGIHCASDTFRNDKDYIDLVGGRFINHGPCHEFPVTITREDHLLTRRVSNFEIFDELYLLDSYDASKVKVLATAHWNHKDEPMLYVKNYGKGRVCYSAMGHGPEAFAHPTLQKLITRAARWVAGLEEKPKVKCAVIGYGGAFNMGKHHCEAINSTPGMEAVAACDLDPKRTDQAKADFPHFKIFNDVDKLVAAKGIDLGVVITPHDSHGPIGLALAKAGKHVISEKPFCITVKEATAIVNAAKRSKVMASVYHNRRWDGDYMAIREVIDKGLIGEVFHVEAYMGGYGRPGTWWRSMKHVSGGAFYDWGAHIIDWVLGMVPGKVTNVTGFYHDNRVWHGVSNEDQVQAVLRFASGAVADIQISSIAHVGKPRFRILGTHGAIEDHWKEKFKLITTVNGVKMESEVRYKNPFWNNYYWNVGDHLLLDEPLNVTAEQARRIIAVIETAEKSSKSGLSEPMPFE